MEIVAVSESDVSPMEVARVTGIFSGEVETLDPALVKAASLQRVRGDLGEIVVAVSDGVSHVGLGLGERSKLSPGSVRRSAGVLARSVGNQPLAVSLRSMIPEGADEGPYLSGLVEGLLLGSYAYRAYLPDDDKYVPPPEKVEVVVESTAQAVETIERARTIAQATCLARDLVNTPARDLSADDFAAVAQAQATRCGFQAEVWDENAIRANGLEGLLAVNSGSSEQPRFVTLSYDGHDGDNIDLALVGKGITFDSGGLSLKPSPYMVGMKGDMGGAAAVLGAFVAVATLGIAVRIRGFLPLTDNMPGPKALKIGDIIRYRNGVSVEVLDTDAEGRLVLADALILAGSLKPDVLVDVATLTGSCMVALGPEIAGLMSTDDRLSQAVIDAARQTGEDVWKLPLPDDLEPTLKSPIADLKNVSDGRYGGALTAGLFLRHFVPDDVPWAHLDIAGPADAEEDRWERRKGGTGFGVGTLVRLASQYAGT